MPRTVLPVSLVAMLSLAPLACSRPCSSPVLYRIGRVDSGFGVSEKELESLLQRAEAVWEDAAGRDLFRRDDGAALVVNLLYDDRQIMAQTNQRLGYDIEKVGGWAEDAKARYEKTRKRYESARDDFLAARAAHDARVDAFNRSVESWNARGGAPPRELAALNREEAAIRASAASVEKQRIAVNDLAQRANDHSERYNKLADEVNANIAAVNSTAGVEFKQGRYVEDASGVRIDIFEFLNRIDLVHVLAHELGHALGLLHNDNPEAIMFGVNSSQHLVPAKEDMAMVRDVCGD